MIKLTKYGAFNPVQYIHVNPDQIKTAERMPIQNAPTVVHLMDGTSIQVNESPERIAALMRTSQR